MIDVSRKINRKVPGESETFVFEPYAHDSDLVPRISESSTDTNCGIPTILSPEFLSRMHTEKLEKWVRTAQNSKILQLTRFANTIIRHWDGIPNMARFRLSVVILEGTNGYIKNMRRSAFASSDFEFFGHTHNNAKRKRDTS